jgi:glycerophosphoryl diester phosphodiesterase
VAITHNGGSEQAPGDTLFALQQAVDEGRQIIDVDLQESKDGVPILMHNDTVDSSTNGTGNVADMTAAQLSALDAAYWWVPDCGFCHGKPANDYIYRGVRTGAKTPPAGATADDFAVPTLRQVFERFPDAIIDIELKPETQTATSVASLIHEFHRENRTIVASFSDAQIAEFKQLAPTVATSPGQTAVTNFFLGKPMPPGFQVVQIPYRYELSGQQVTVLTPDFIKRAHAAGLAVWVWDQGCTSGPGTACYEELAKIGPDGILASRPTDLLAVLNRLGLLWDGVYHPPATTPATTAPSTAPSPAAPANPTSATPRFTG